MHVSNWSLATYSFFSSSELLPNALESLDSMSCFIQCVWCFLQPKASFLLNVVFNLLLMLSCLLFTLMSNEAELHEFDMSVDF